MELLHSVYSLKVVLWNSYFIHCFNFCFCQIVTLTRKAYNLLFSAHILEKKMIGSTTEVLTSLSFKSFITSPDQFSSDGKISFSLPAAFLCCRFISSFYLISLIFQILQLIIHCLIQDVKSITSCFIFFSLTNYDIPSMSKWNEWKKTKQS